MDLQFRLLKAAEAAGLPTDCPSAVKSVRDPSAKPHRNQQNANESRHETKSNAEEGGTDYTAPGKTLEKQESSIGEQKSCGQEVDGMEDRNRETFGETNTERSNETVKKNQRQCCCCAISWVKTLPVQTLSSRLNALEAALDDLRVIFPDAKP